MLRDSEPDRRVGPPKMNSSSWRIADCFASIDYFERSGTPFIIAVNCFDGAPRFDPEDIRIALTLSPDVPIVMCDARHRDSVKKALVSLVRYVMNSRSQQSQ